MNVSVRSCAAAFAVAMGSLALATAASAQQINVICSVQAEWCTAVANEFQRRPIRSRCLGGSGESMAQIAAERRTRSSTSGSARHHGDPH
jgi:iron(III) transport system substrate-binding protein